MEECTAVGFQRDYVPTLVWQFLVLQTFFPMESSSSSTELHGGIGMHVKVCWVLAEDLKSNPGAF